MPNILARSGLLFLAPFIWACQGTAPHASEPAPDLVIEHANVITGNGDQLLQDMRVSVRDGVITSIDRSYGQDIAASRTLDVQGKFLVPGFIDMHAHLLFPRCGRATGQIRFDRDLSERALGAMLDSGVTFIRSPANPTIEGLALRDDLNLGRVRGPRAVASTELLNDPRMDEEAVAAYVQAAASLKPDYHKAYAGLSNSQVAALTKLAHQAGVPVIGHLQRVSWREGIELGVDHLAHVVDWSPKSLPPDKIDQYRASIDGLKGFKYRIAWLETFDPESAQMRDLAKLLAERQVSVDLTLVAYAGKFSRPVQAQYAAGAELDGFPELKNDWSRCGTGAENWTDNDYAR